MQRTFNPRIVGSSPTEHTTFLKNTQDAEGWQVRYSAHTRGLEFLSSEQLQPVYSLRKITSRVGVAI